MAICLLVNPRINAIDLSIHIGDRPYYDGTSYWEDGYLWVWIPGYDYHGHWVHGHYERRGEWHREHAHEHHEHHRDRDR
jgi:hypothetical protein